MTTARDQLYLDLFTTAVEGGINYWADIKSYHWQTSSDGRYVGNEDYLGFYADIEHEDGSHHIDRQVIVRGYNLATDAVAGWRRLNWSTEPPPVFIRDDTDWDFDAGDADMIVQLGLFGEVVYG